ncbi:2OG-Fe(II) oxygenase family protein [Sphingomonas flavalba]|uniref:2OG-Fe(II) oxygenase family protein n=1 Tax=Sphingomonas flavalba TaxID=2559804 RepID=UPI0039E074B8
MPDFDHVPLDELAARLGGNLADPEAAFAYGRAALDRFEEEAALPLLAEVARAQPDNAVVWQLIGLLNRALDRHGEAAAALATAAHLAPDDASIAHGRARVALEAGRPASALFEWAGRLAPNDGEVLLGRAAARFAEGRTDLAIDGLDALLVQHPGWLPGHEQIARLRWMTGERGGFARSLERAIATAPGDLSLWRALIILLIHAEQMTEALEVIERGRRFAGPDAAFDANEATAASELGDHARADRLFDRMLEINDMTLVVRHVRHLLRTGRFDQAASRAQPFLTHPEANLLWPYMATIWRLLGDPRADWLMGDPRLVGTIDLAAEIPDLPALAEHLRGLHLATHQHLDQSVRSGTQTDGPLFSRDEPEIRALRAVIVEAVRAHAAQLPPEDRTHPVLGAARPADVRFSGSWSVRLTDRGHHASHTHPMGWYSSALYVALPASIGKGDPHAGWLSVGAPPPELNLALPPIRRIEPAPGRLALFPSIMWHGTVPFEAGERLTVAFDVAPRLVS